MGKKEPPHFKRSVKMSNIKISMGFEDYRKKIAKRNNNKINSKYHSLPLKTKYMCKKEAITKYLCIL
jgi:hypothetical protein